MYAYHRVLGNLRSMVRSSRTLLLLALRRLLTWAYTHCVFDAQVREQHNSEAVGRPTRRVYAS